MKPRTYQARQLDPTSIVIPLKDYNKAVENIRNEAISAYESMYKIGSIDKDMLEYLKDRINNVFKNK